jgi:hypothetical protein
MKIGIVFMLACYTLTVKSQNTPCGDSSLNWHLEKNNTFIQVVYSDTAKDSSTLINLLLMQSKTIAGASNFQVLNGSLMFTVQNYRVDYQKQGVSWANTCICYIHPMDFQVSVDITDYKYRVTISSIVTKVNTGGIQPTLYNWSIDIFKRKGCIRSLGYNSIINALGVVRSDLSGLFEIKGIPKKTDW